MRSTRTVRILSVLLILLLVIGVIAFKRETVLADTDATTGIVYTISGGEATITDFIAPSGFSGALSIPATLGGAPVTSIGYQTFYESSSLKSVTIPSSVTSIENYAFLECNSLTLITVDAANPAYKSVYGSLLTKDGTRFICCPAGKTGNLSIPSGVTNILTGAVAYCQQLSGVTIPYGVTIIGDHAFYMCTGFTIITIPGTVTQILQGAFQLCSGLSDAYFFGNAPIIGAYALSMCSADFTVHYLSTSTGFTSPWEGFTTELFSAGVSYQTHIQDIGWQGYVSNGTASGTSGQSKRLEAIRIKLTLEGITGGIEYRTHVQEIGWQEGVVDDAISGTSGQSKRLEAIQVRLNGEIVKLYDVYYRVHVQDTGWMDWAKGQLPAGTSGYAYRLEAIEIRLVRKGDPAPGPTARPFVDLYSSAVVSYKTHVQDIGWQGYVSNGVVSGTSGESKRLEAIQIKLVNVPGGIEYSTHVQDIGWQAFVANDALSGTSGQSKRLEAIKIRLTGMAAEAFDVYYCVHAQNMGWLDWAKNGQSAGTAGFGYRLEAIKIVLVAKGGAEPGATARAFVQG